MSDALTDKDIPLPANKYCDHKNNHSLKDIIDEYVGAYHSFDNDMANKEGKQLRKGILNTLVKRVTVDLGLRFVRKNAQGKWVRVQPVDERESIRQRIAARKNITSTAPPPITTNLGESAPAPVVITPTPGSTQQNTNNPFFASGASNSGEPEGVRSVGRDDILWDGTVTQEHLDLLVQVIESEQVRTFLQREAKQHNNKSVTNINGALQVFLSKEKGNAITYKRLVRFYPKDKTGWFLEPETLMAFIRASVVGKHSDLKDHVLTQPSILLGHGSRGPQPTHCDTKQPAEGLAELFGIFMLSKNAPGTIYCDMKGVPTLPTAEDLVELWKGEAPKNLLAKLKEIDGTKAMQDSDLGFLAAYGRLCFASLDKRTRQRIVEQYSAILLRGSHPHCAPACDMTRAVIFFVLQPPDFQGEPYDGKSQMSKEKLYLMLNEVLMAHSGGEVSPAEVFLLEKTIDAIEESAKLGARDGTIKLDQYLDQAVKDLQDAAADVQEKEDAFHSDNQTLLEKENNLKTATVEHDFAKDAFLEFSNSNREQAATDPLDHRMERATMLVSVMQDTREAVTEAENACSASLVKSLVSEKAWNEAMEELQFHKKIVLAAIFGEDYMESLKNRSE